MADPICLSCDKYSVTKGHPSGYEHFCSANHSSGSPQSIFAFPSACAEHPKTLFRPNPNAVSVDGRIQGLGTNQKSAKVADGE